MTLQKPKVFRSHGKLLITGEYLVLDGALALATPTKYGQNLSVKAIDESIISWRSYDENNTVWYQESFDIYKEKLIQKTNKSSELSNRLLQILNTIQTLNPTFLKTSPGFEISSHLEFPKDWGLGSSSTLINNLAQWAEVNPYVVLEKTFGGSGYDIACAEASKAITYQIKNNTPEVESVDFNPLFKQHLYFVHLNKKQNSREAIQHYKTRKSNVTSVIEDINEITKSILNCKHLDDFKKLLEVHEAIIGKVIKTEPIKKQLFNDFEGSIKSLGAWGGDFILVASKIDPKPYFQSKGFTTIIDFDAMVYNKKSST